MTTELEANIDGEGVMVRANVDGRRGPWHRVAIGTIKHAHVSLIDSNRAQIDVIESDESRRSILILHHGTIITTLDDRPEHDAAWRAPGLN